MTAIMRVQSLTVRRLRTADLEAKDPFQEDRRAENQKQLGRFCVGGYLMISEGESTGTSAGLGPQGLEALLPKQVIMAAQRAFGGAFGGMRGRLRALGSPVESAPFFFQVFWGRGSVFFLNCAGQKRMPFFFPVATGRLREGSHQDMSQPAQGGKYGGRLGTPVSSCGKVLISLPEFMNFFFFGKTILSLDLFWAIHPASELLGHQKVPRFREALHAFQRTC